MTTFGRCCGAVLLFLPLVVASASPTPKTHAERARLNAALIAACEKGDVTEAKSLISRGANVNAEVSRRGDDSTPLVAASRHGSVPLVRLLLRHGAEVNPRVHPDFDHAGTLAWAADRGHLEVARLLLAHGATVNARERFGTALTRAVERGNRPMVRLLLAHGANPMVGEYHSTLPYIAAFEGRAAILRLLIRAGADVRQTGHFGSTTLQAAATCGDIETMKIVLAHDRRIDMTDQSELRTPLMESADYGRTEAVRLLLKLGASVKLRDRDGMTALSIAAREGHREIVRLLLTHRARTDAVDSRGHTLLMSAVQGSDHAERGPNPKIVALLLQLGLDVNAKTPDGETALTLARKGGYGAIVKMLRDAGAQE